MSVDHKPQDAAERARIEAAGGVVAWAGTWRVQGVLAVSRAIGDRPLKRYVISRPDVVEEALTPKGAPVGRGGQQCCSLFEGGGAFSTHANETKPDAIKNTQKRPQTTASSSRPTACGTWSTTPRRAASFRAPTRGARRASSSRRRTRAAASTTSRRSSSSSNFEMRPAPGPAPGPLSPLSLPLCVGFDPTRRLSSILCALTPFCALSWFCGRPGTQNSLYHPLSARRARPH